MKEAKSTLQGKQPPVKIPLDTATPLRRLLKLESIFHEAMGKAEAAGNKDCPVKIKRVAPPICVLNAQTLDKRRLGSRA
ncbi:hypothetical protein RND71_009669 [Anisodus tanguticus]|uniref:Uncharacterized protein n=1 Tax=Anisodus tanguticus TaxID=243964 RepID=A0AAE1VRF3_9SOLA|nr:hypothetical protein RND71_009669 [Anisodus tanguticus]